MKSAWIKWLLCNFILTYICGSSVFCIRVCRYPHPSHITVYIGAPKWHHLHHVHLTSENKVFLVQYNYMFISFQSQICRDHEFRTEPTRLIKRTLWLLKTFNKNEWIVFKDQLAHKWSIYGKFQWILMNGVLHLCQGL